VAWLAGLCGLLLGALSAYAIVSWRAGAPSNSVAAGAAAAGPAAPVARSSAE